MTPPSGGTAPASPATGSSQPESTIELPSGSADATNLVGGSSLGLVILATSSVGGVSGFEGGPASPNPLAQSVTTGPTSPITTGLIALGTSFPLLGHGEVGGGTPPDPEGAEPETTTVEMARVDAVPIRLPDPVGWLTAMVRELLVNAATSDPKPPSIPIATEFSSLAIAGPAVDAVDAGYVRGGDFPSGSEGYHDGYDWSRMWSIVIASTGLATVLYAGHRRHRRRAECRGSGPESAPHGPAPEPSTRTVLGTARRSPSTVFQTVRRLGPLPVATMRLGWGKTATVSSGPTRARRDR